MAQRQQGQYVQADFFQNSGGLNITDSPFVLNETQASAGMNYDYTSTGGIRKRNGHTKLNSSADSQTRALGFALYNSSSGTKKILRAAGSKLQVLNTTTGGTTNIIEDTLAAGTTAFSSNQPVVSSQFNTTLGDGTWFAGGGSASGVVWGYNGTHMTKNGAVPPAGSIGLSSATSGGFLPDTTSYFYAVALHKASTSVTSNVALDTAVTTGSGSGANTVTIDLTGLTGLDTTKYDLIYIYRSAAAGVTGFTTGDLVARVASSTTSYVDTGTVQGSGTLVPRANNLFLDNSVLPAGTYNVLTTFKRRLVTAQNSTLYFSDLNKPESWPTVNTITIPSGGPISALGIISFSTPTTSSTDEFLCVFKENELWVVTGTGIDDYSLKFVDYVGCIAQPLVVLGNGFLAWVDYRGIYLWDGSSKPVYTSRLVEYDFGVDGDIDKANLTLGNGSFYKKQNEIIWHLSSKSLGTQKLVYKMDLRLTLPQMANGLAGRTLEAVFIKDTLTYPIYACLSTLPTYDEIFYGGDISGYTYQLFNNINSDAGSAIDFKYRTKTDDLGSFSSAKRYHKVIVWCRDSTINNLTLNYWVGYKTDDSHKATQELPVTTQVTNAVWDQSTWDSPYWDTNLVTYSPIVFNLGNPNIGVEGDALTLEFQQSDANSPIIIAGYSILYTLAGLRK